MWSRRTLLMGGATISAGTGLSREIQARPAWLGNRDDIADGQGGIGSAAPAGHEASDIAARLRSAFIWSREHISIPMDSGDLVIADPATQKGKDLTDCHAAFVKTFDLEVAPVNAAIHIFAYTRYRLYVNGRYVGRGPARYENDRPEYDTRNVAPFLVPGRNVVAVLVHRDAPTGRIMSHAPGTAAVMVWRDAKGMEQTVGTDESWRSMPERSFGPRRMAWASIEENIDASAMPDWTASDFDAGDWPQAVRLGEDSVKPLWPRAIPLLRETVQEWAAPPDFPHELKAGQTLNLKLNGLTLSYHSLDFDADAGSEIEVRYLLPDDEASGSNRYKARAGRQTYESGDTFAFVTLAITVKSGRITLHGARAVEVLYPFDIEGAFESSDPQLNRLWGICARSLALLSEDAYVDCADRERVEWTDETPPAFECTRVMMAGQTDGGGKLWSDPRLLKMLLQRIALTQREDGQLKAHSCSERWDIHAIMEDRSCDWVIALRQYYDATNDLGFVRSLWPRVVKLLAWFLNQRTSRGLIQAREWEVWDNPLRYQVCEGTGLNAFAYQALVDAAYLGVHLGAATEARSFASGAQDLGRAVNKVLWDESSGAYFGGLFREGSKLSTQLNSTMFNGPFLAGGFYRATLQANLFALDSGLVPPARRARVKAFVLRQQAEATGIMTHHFLFKSLYAFNAQACDVRVLELMREKWRAMIDSKWGTTWEDLQGGGSKVHVYGIVPAWFLSAYVLGVQAQSPAADRTLLIEPRPGDLTFAKGVVVTEFGPVPIHWQQSSKGMHVEVTVPEACRTILQFGPTTIQHVTVNGDNRQVRTSGGRQFIHLESGRQTITYT